MHVPAYWAKADAPLADRAGDRVSAWRWSDESLAEARAAAAARVAEQTRMRLSRPLVATCLPSGAKPTPNTGC